ncbi:MAG: hypothetical protein HYS27_25685 [Deltaproteobacteria bacterium]|nr:hypothetical protein [Deltaproteobacteria bacterium]
MSFLALSDDELALMRFTCDLFFVEESPLYYLDESQREPADYAAAYHALVGRGVIDPHGFRVTDDALNRIAPVTECDGRLTHVVHHADGTSTASEQWLLDEIAVSYEKVADRHVFGPDRDQDEVVENLARRFVPRRAAGDRVQLTLSAIEMLALGQLLEAVKGEARRDLALAAVKRAFTKPPPADQRPPSAPLLPMARRPMRARTGAIVDDAVWDDALRGLIEKGAVVHGGAAVWLANGLLDLATRPLGDRHTLVRTDFGDGDWFVRETTFVPVEGSLFFLGPRGGGIAVEELDGDRLRAALIEAVGPLQRDRAGPGAQRLSELLVRQEPVKA